MKSTDPHQRKKDRKMMKRKLFYLFEKLQIKKSERIAITSLMVLTIILSGLNAYPDWLFHQEQFDYSRSDSLFVSLSAQLQQEEEEIMLRYQPLDESDQNLASETQYRAERDTIPPDSTDQGKNTETDSLININTATAEKLQELPGIGPAYSTRIVEWRNENGQFTSKDQLIEIKGIGEKRLATIKPLIRL